MVAVFLVLACGIEEAPPGPPRPPSDLCCEVMAAWCIQDRACDLPEAAQREACWSCGGMTTYRPDPEDEDYLRESLDEIEAMECGDSMPENYAAWWAPCELIYYY